MKVILLQIAVFLLTVGLCYLIFTGIYNYFKEEDEIVGYLYLGTPEVDIKKPIRHKPETFFENL